VLGNLLRYRLNVIQLLHHVIVVPQLLVQVTIVGIVAVALPATELAIAAPPLIPACHAFAQLPLLSHLSCLRHTHMGPTSLEGQGLTTTSKSGLGGQWQVFWPPRPVRRPEGARRPLGAWGGLRGGQVWVLSGQRSAGPPLPHFTGLWPPTKPHLTQAHL